jgi:hypothetical protein
MVSGLLVVAAGAIAIVSNPQIPRYEDFASVQIASYLKESVCQNSENNLPINLGQFNSRALENYCKTLVDASQPQLGELIGEKTSQQNYFFFSIYQTEIQLPDPLPDYSFETIGLFNHFFTYRTEKF